MNNYFDILKGEQLSSIVFIQDYLQLDFDGKLLTCYEWPKVFLQGKEYTIADVHFRNALCSLIAKLVSNTIFIDEVSLIIEFEKFGEIFFDIKNANGEILYFTQQGNNEWLSV